MIALFLGLFSGFLILHAPFFEEKAEGVQEKLMDNPSDVILFLQVFVVPPLIYESALNMI